MAAVSERHAPLTPEEKMSLGALKGERKETKQRKGKGQRGICCSTDASGVLPCVILIISSRLHPSPPITAPGSTCRDTIVDSPGSTRTPRLYSSTHALPGARRDQWRGGYMDYPARTGLGGMKDTHGVSPSRERDRVRERSERGRKTTSRTAVDEN